MTFAAAVLFAVSAAAQLVGVALILVDIVHARRLLRHGNMGRIDGGNAAGVSSVEGSLVDAVAYLVKTHARQTWAVFLIVVGIVTGTVGNYCALTWS